MDKPTCCELAMDGYACGCRTEDKVMAKKQKPESAITKAIVYEETGPVAGVLREAGYLKKVNQGGHTIKAQSQSEKDYLNRPKGILSRKLEAAEARIDKLERALLVVSEAVNSGEWQGVHAWTLAILEVEEE